MDGGEGPPAVAENPHIDKQKAKLNAIPDVNEP
jgi:hypothetical protein